ncbi:2,3-bisphosphoglycerate-dependent phosphoglycerate mutase [Limosilactobacillus vaginalis]|uniref:2,3-bisphosphoglycerate-dependent phosphoglycerate mutase n=1 Tax=Limosilactobacillus vaginalis TaxID=1633 RepID=UPI0021DFB073|nr:2,3-bisphosphoglycerate-dependent phosphoglycerate mutase [Limosilactobacillus vaginalis]UYD06896.1 2,3-bisphosphoglycerate-dependent phosphoglycerate mutase [Limosilactobacillus vaginalis]
MAKLVIVRHGQSQANRDNIFTGWTDVPLTEKGIEQGQMVGDELARMGIQFDDAHTSYMSRAIKMMNIILERIDQLYIPVYKTWRLNERHYGALSGLNKAKVKEEVGTEQLHRWRRGYSEVPPKLKHRQHERRYDRLGVKMPYSESLAMTQKRLLPYWEDQIAPRLMDGKNQLIVAHGSSLRALIKYLDQIPDDQIDQVEVPNGKPILYELDPALNITKKTFITMDGEENGNS